MELPVGPLVQNFGNSEAANSGFSFQGNVSGNIQLNHSRDSPPELFDRLPEAAFNAASKDHSPSCLENTRRDVLKQIEKWADDDDERRIYWLKGMAGIGKSTIALTVARKYDTLGRLGASFFFSRGGGDLASSKKFASTIAAQLADTIPGLRKLIEDAITSNSQIRDLGLYSQWDKLVLEPLRLVKNVCRLPVVIVIDALDECDNEDDISLLIRCLAAATAVKSLRLHILVTSRPEQPINLGFDSISSGLHQDFILHDIERSIVDQDLILFYKDRLTYTAKKFGLGNLILSDESIQSLVRKSHGLFIHAATVCRFIAEGGQLANERLSLVITAGSTPSKPEKELDQIYTTVLIHSLPTQLEPEEVAKVQTLFRRIVGSIIVLSEEMTPADLAVMLEEPKDIILSTLHCLHSLLDVPGETKPIRLLHPSLRDFLLDSKRCQSETFLIDAKAIHGHLFDCCLRVMEHHLRQNICNIKRPGMRARDISKAAVEKFISLPLQYACRYWIYHLRRSRVDPNDSTEIMDFFQTRFLYWLETLSLIGRLSEGITMIRLLETELAVSNLKRDNLIERRTMFSRVKTMPKQNFIYTVSLSHPSVNNLHSTVYDAMRFVLSHSAVIEESPLQVYYSALIFSPGKSIIRKYYSNEIPKWILHHPICYDDWRPYLQTLKGHSESVNAVTFSPDGRLIASASDDKTIRLWDATTGAEQYILKGHLQRISTITFSPDGRLIMSASHDKTIRLWDATTGAERRVLKGHSPYTRLWDATIKAKQYVLNGHSDLLYPVIFSPDGQLIASASDNTIWLWDTTTGVEQYILEGHSDWINTVAFSPDGQLIASASYDQTIRLWDTTTGVEQYILEGHLDWIYTVVFSPDGRLIASASCDRTVRLWDVTTGTEWCVLNVLSDSFYAAARLLGVAEGVPRHLNGFSDLATVAFSPDGRLIASASRDTTIWLWDVIIGTARHALKGHSTFVKTIIFSPDGQLIASASDNTLRLWDTTTGVERCILEGHSDWITTVAFSPDGRLIASASRDRTVRLWDASTVAERRVLKGHSPWFHTRLWDVIRGTEPRVLKNHVAGLLYIILLLWYVIIGPGSAQSELIGLSGLVITVAFSQDGQLIASASLCDDTIQLWDVTTGAVRHVLKGHSDIVKTIVFSPDGRFMASTSRDKTIRLWDTTTGAEQYALKEHLQQIYTITFSPDSRLIASVSHNQTIRLWDVTTGAERHVLKGHSDLVRTIAFSPDGQFIASASHDKTIRLWDTTTAVEQYILNSHSGIFSAINFSPNGQYLASASGDRIIQLWDVITGVEQYILKGHLDLVDIIIFSPDSQLIASASHDGNIRLWNVTTGTEQHILKGHLDWIYTIAFSPDSQILASSSHDGTVRLWDVTTGIERHVLTCHSDSVRTIAFSPDGRLNIT